MTMYVNGHIHEELYDQHSIPDDRDLAGEIVRKYFGIGSEHSQRAKIVSNKTQIDARRQRLAGIAYDRYQAALDRFQKEESTYELNKTAARASLLFFGKITSRALQSTSIPKESQ